MMTTIKPISTLRVFGSIASHANGLSERAAAVVTATALLGIHLEEQGSIQDESNIRRSKRMSCLFCEQLEPFGKRTLVVVSTITFSRNVMRSLMAWDTVSGFVSTGFW